jgi:hypothetical protein
MKKQKASKTTPSKNKVKKRKKAKKIVQTIGMTMEEIYACINKIQIERIDSEITVDPNLSMVLENILKDCNMSFTKKANEKDVCFFVSPPPKKVISDDYYVFVDEMPDELLEDGFCF